jgi:hypothetical protein
MSQDRLVQALQLRHRELLRHQATTELEGARTGPQRLERTADDGLIFRADRVRTKKGPGGVGLGLSLVKRIVEAHGGTIELAPAEDRGTRATIRLPVRNAEQAPPRCLTPYRDTLPATTTSADYAGLGDGGGPRELPVLGRL